MRVYIIASILIILGLLAIAYKGTLDGTHWFVPYLADVSSALLVGGLLSLLFKIFQDREAENTLRRLLRNHDSVDDLGLREIKPEVHGYNFTNLLENSNHISIIMNDGLRWIGNHAVALQKRFSCSTQTDFFLVDPDSAFVSVLAQKTSTTQNDLEKKIKEAWSRIDYAWEHSEKKGTVRIYKLKTYPTKSVFLTETKLVETPYQTASGRANIPLFLYGKVVRKDSLYEFVKNDIDELRKECELEREYKN